MSSSSTMPMDVRKQLDMTSDIILMFVRVFFASLQFGIFGWRCFYKTYHENSSFGRAVEHPPDVVLLACGAYFLFASLLDYGRLFISELFASRFIERYRDRFFALCLPLAVVPFLSALGTLAYVWTRRPKVLNALDNEELLIVLLAHAVPAVLLAVELLIEKHISLRRLFSETLAALLGGVAYALWTAVFRNQSGPLSAEKYLWDLAVPLGVAYAFALALLFVATYFLARRISRWRWRNEIEYEELIA